MTAQIEVLNPVYARLPGLHLRRANFPRLNPGDRLRLGFLNNQKPNTEELLALVKRGLGERYQVEAKTFYKPDAAHGARPEVIGDLHEYADVAITATCD